MNVDSDDDDDDHINDNCESCQSEEPAMKCKRVALRWICAHERQNKQLSQST